MALDSGGLSRRGRAYITSERLDVCLRADELSLAEARGLMLQSSCVGVSHRADPGPLFCGSRQRCPFLVGFA